MLFSINCRNLLETVFAHIEQSSLIPNYLSSRTCMLRTNFKTQQIEQKLKLSVNRFILLFIINDSIGVQPTIVQLTSI